MSDNELLAVVAKRELNEFTHKKVLEWAANRLIHMSNVIYTIESETLDVKENERLLYHLAEANTSLTYAIQATGAEHKNKIAPRSASSNVYRNLIKEKNKVCDFVTFEMKEHDKMSGRPDKMADFVKVFFSELDNFEEEMYNVI